MVLTGFLEISRSRRKPCQKGPKCAKHTTPERYR
uniref:Uncharacterized protein n=1 Tax=Arundo donax TaxID=35708 RepID=A0A0A9DWC7_ARUDO